MSWKWTRTKWWVLIIIVVAGIGAMIFTMNNQRFYRQPIGQVITVHNGQSHRTTDQFKNIDHQTSQRLTVRIMNGHYQGQTAKVSNTYSDSQPMDQRFYHGNQIFLSQLHANKRGQLMANASGYKRDTVIVFLLWMVVLLLLVLMGTSGAFALLSVVINGILFILAIVIDLDNQGAHVLLTFGSLALAFAAISLLLVLGPNKKMLATLLATIVGTVISIMVGLFILELTHHRGVYYESMQYVTQVPRPLFIAEILLGSLGAVMDESSDIIATLFELKQLNPAIGRWQLFMSGRNVGKSIMGPLVNVLFLIFMADTFTSSLLFLKNGNSWGYTFDMNMSLGMVQSLISGIGIVIVVPVVSALGALLLGRRKSA